MQVYRCYGKSSFDIKKFNKPFFIEGFSYTNKPIGGLWASPLEKDTTQWKQWCEQEYFHVNKLKKFFDFTLDKKAKVLQVNDDDDLKDIPIIEKKLLQENFLVLDWNKLFETYDAFEIVNPRSIELAKKFPKRKGVKNEHYFYLAPFSSWDVTSILVFNPGIVKLR